MSTLIPVGMDSTTGQFKIPGPTDLINGMAVVGSVPTLVLGTAAGSGASSSIVGTNLAGKITLNSGTGVLASGIVMTMTFANTFTFPSGCVVLFSAGNSNFASVVQYISSTTTTTTVVLNISLGLSISSTYIGYYTVQGW